MRSLYDKLFTDYGGQIGYAPAVATIAIGLMLCGALIYGGINIGKAVYADPLAKKAAIGVVNHG
jgi:hypothetical protein